MKFLLHNLVKEKFTAESVAKQMQELYEWIYYGNSKPEFIHI